MIEGIRILAICFVDVVIGVSLFVLACIIGGAAHQAFTPHLEFLYIAWFILALLPFFHYAKWRGVLDFDGWDFFAYGVTAIIITSFTDLLPQPLIPFETSLKALIVAFVLTQWESFRKTTFPRPNQTRETSAES